MHPNEIALNDYVEAALDAAGRAEVERHLASCEECRALVDDMQAIRGAAASLELRDAPARSWPRLERAIKLEQAHSKGGRRGIYVGLAAAAAIVIAVSVGLRYRPAAPVAPADAARPAAEVSSAAEVEAELRAAETHYDKAIQGLEQITNAEKGTLDTQTAATLQKNLAVIDQAINESRAAVRAQPTSEPAQQSLIESFKAKLALLQDTVALINEMRKGNEAGAAQIGSGLRQKG